ncbi:type I polyketide synthase [Amycolatopsis sp. NPDC004772]
MMANEQKLRDYLKFVTADLKDTRDRLADVEARDSEPVAIVAMSCRYPGGVASPEDLWRLVESGTDAIGGFPGDRGWPLGRFQGGFLHDAAEFDADFFGISPREALAMDPQQRLLLETSWELLERARIAPKSLRRSSTGVFVGGAASGYGTAGDEEVAGYLLTGTAGSVLSGRLSYHLGLEGPSLTIDSACSSSLVALHLATQALRRGECILAIAGGVTIMATPGTFAEFDRQGGLAADGRCKAFADAADGTGWAEGVGLLLVERLSDARRNGHPVLALLRGSAVNSDGASNGLTAPNGPSQRRVITAALSAAGLSPSDVDVVEAHGTGTALGDPIEAQALLATYGQDRSTPLWLGSVKSNIGHTQSASGVAGVIKMVQAMRHGVLPQTLHVDSPSSKIDWSTGEVRLLTSAREWPAERPRRAGVSSFGISGTNAHVILEGVSPSPTSSPSPLSGPVPWLVSGRGAEALCAQAAALVPYADESPLEVGATLLSGRATFEDRAVVFGSSAAEFRTGLSALAAGGEAPNVVRGRVVPGGLAVLFTGQGAQRVGMGLELYERFPVYAAAFDEVLSHFDPSLRAAFDDQSLLDRTEFTQPALFALEVALFRLVSSFGVRPDFVAGHSIGELVAAHVAGVLSLEDACRLVSARASLMQALPAGGAMVSIVAPESAIPLTEGVAVAAVNGPESVVISGDEAAVLDIAAQFPKTKRLPVSHAFHSPLMDPMLAEFRAIAETLTYHPAQIPVLSNVSGALASTFSAEYWVRHVRETVRFADGVSTLESAGVGVFLELGPDGILSAMVGGTAIPALRRDRSETRALLSALSTAHVQGVVVDWTQLLPSERHADLPTYAFQRQHYWLTGPPPEVSTEDRAFWSAVESPNLAETLGLDEQLAEAIRPALSAWRDRSRRDGKVASWRYRTEWKPLVPAAGQPGDWLLIAPEGSEPAAALATLLTGVVPLTVTNESRPALADRLRELSAHNWTAILSLVDLPATATLVQALGDAGIKAPLWSLTRGAVTIGRSDELKAPEQASLWGFGRTAALEHPDRWGGLVDLPPTLDTRAAARLLAVVGGSEDQVAIRASGAFARRLVPAPPTGPSRNWHPRGTVLITGGTGALGARVARWAAANGADRLVLISRRGPDTPGAEDLAAELANAGTETTIKSCDVTDRDALAAVVDQIGDDLRAVVHTAGTLDDGIIDTLTPERLANVEAAKVTGAVNLSELTRNLDAFIVFSGMAATLGAAGQAAYAAANARLDALAEARRAAGRPALAVAWGPWSGGGMAGADITARLAAAGLRPLDPDLALAALEGALSTGDTTITIADIDWQIFAPAFAAVRPSPLLAELPASTRNAGGITAPATNRAFPAASKTANTIARSTTANPAAAAAANPAAAAANPAAAAAANPAAVGARNAAAAAVANPAADPAAGGARNPAAANARDSAVAAARNAAAAAVANPAAAAARDSATGARGFTAAGVLELVREQVAAVLGHASGGSVDRRRAFSDLGFTSLSAVELRNRLRSATGLELSATLTFDHPDPDALAQHLCALLQGKSTALEMEHPAGMRDDEPIAIVAMACRFPGDVRSPEDLWDLVARGGDALSAPPVDRGWPSALGAVKPGGFLTDVADFDAELFGISPREATAMDPQQRLLLETAWELFERAGRDPRSVRGERVGVFAGTNGQDYPALLTDAGDDVAGYVGTGNAAAVVSGRIAYAFGLEGPAVTVDTACSSSLVALHWARQALRAGECDLAVAGGVTVMATPGAFVEFDRQGGLAPDGRCKAFAEGADGTGWGEGVGLLLVERLSDARRNGHEVLAVVRGSAVNSDGASNGLTAPNGPSQQRVIRAALADAGLGPSEVDAVEAHGTGTKLGDPIEAQALLATYGQGRDEPLWLGSVKSNLGHTQAAAGVAGIIKMVMAMRNGVLPRTLHVDAPSSQVDWSAGAVEVLAETRKWPSDRPRRAGVSSFGISGTNAHTILEQAPDDVVVHDTAPVGLLPVPVSAQTEPGLREQARRLLAGERGALPDVAFSLATGRAALSRRAVVLAEDDGDLVRGLTALADGAPDPGVIRGDVEPGSLAVLFTGQGAQRVGMGRGLYDRFPVYAEAFDAVCAEFDLLLERPLHDVVFAGSTLDATGSAQPALFAVEVALYRLFESWRVRPDFVAGHSIGEISAAHVAGVLSLVDACRLVAARASLMQALPAGGAMVSIAAPESAIVLQEGVSIAAVNGPESVVISGDEAAVLAIAAEFAERGVKTKRLTVSHAFHSPLMDPMLDEFRAVAEQLQYHPAQIPVLSNVSGALALPFDAAYWARHVREAVRFADGVSTLEESGVGVFLELGPDGVLSSMVPGRAIPALRRDRDEVRTFFTALAGLSTAGVPVDWTELPGRRIPLPTYAFQRERFWPAPRPAGGELDAQFWSAVDRADVAGLAAGTGVPEEDVAKVLPALASWRRDRAGAVETESWRYRVTWVPVPEPGAVIPSGRYAIVAAPGAARRWADALVRPGVCVAGPGEPAEGPFDGVFLVSAPGDDALADAAALARAGVGPLWCVTSGAVAVPGDAAAGDPGLAALWGFGRALALETPDRWGGLVDVPETPDERLVAQVWGIVAGARGPLQAVQHGADAEDQIALRPSGTYARRIVRAPLPAAQWTPSGTVLVTGGTGALGATVARWAARAGADHLVLLSRRGPQAPGADSLVEDLEAAGAKATVLACDVSDRDDLARAIGQIPQVTAVVHAAGVSQATAFADLSDDDFRKVLHAKVAGADHLDQLLGDDLDAFILFSSISGIWGAGGQTAYAAANAHLDALAERRRAAGRKATSVAWGPWAGSGMAAGAAEQEHLRRRGLTPLPADAALTAMRTAGEDSVVVADVDWARFAAAFTATRPSRLLAELPEAKLPEPQPAEVRRPADLLALVRTEAAQVLGHATADAVDAKRAFTELGFDSLTAVELRTRLAAATGLTLPPTLVFNHPNATALAEHLRAQLDDGAPSVLAELDRLEAALAAGEPDRLTRTELAVRLQTLLGRYSEREEKTGELDFADDDALLEFINNDLGKL